MEDKLINMMMDDATTDGEKLNALDKLKRRLNGRTLSIGGRGNLSSGQKREFNVKNTNEYRMLYVFAENQRKTIDELTESCKELNRRCYELRDNCRRLDKDYHNRDRGYKQLEGICSALKSECHELKQTNAELESKMSKKESKIKIAVTEIRNILAWIFVLVTTAWVIYSLMK